MGTGTEIRDREMSCPLSFMWKLGKEWEGRVGPVLSVEWPSEEQTLGEVERVS